MNNIKNTIIYANIKGENGLREVREARFTKMLVEPCDINLTRDDVVSGFIDTNFGIEIAGLGETDAIGLRKLEGNLYSTEEDALSSKNEIYQYRYGDSTSLKLSWANLKLSDLNLNHKSMYVSEPARNTCRPLRVYAWYWDGTRAVRKDICDYKKFMYDFLENRIIERKQNDIDKLGTLYATREACEKENTPKVVRFNAKPKKCDVVVRFEITKKVTLTDDCDECEAILQGVKLIKSMSEDELYDECTEYYQE